MSGGITYKIANIEHSGSSIEAGASIKTKVIQLNDAILNQLRVDKTPIRTLNSTHLNTTIYSYYDKLKQLPLAAELKNIDWLNDAVKAGKST